MDTIASKNKQASFALIRVDEYFNSWRINSNAVKMMTTTTTVVVVVVVMMMTMMMMAMMMMMVDKLIE